MSSQPSHLPSSVFVQSEASLLQSRSVPAAQSQSLCACLTALLRSSGRLDVKALAGLGFAELIVLDSLHFVQPAHVALFAAERGLQKSFRGILRKHLADDAGAEHQNVHVVVFDALMRGVVVVAKPCADAFELIGRDRNSDPAAANENTPFRIARENVLGHEN